jgi:hypothetical protein
MIADGEAHYDFAYNMQTDFVARFFPVQQIEGNGARSVKLINSLPGMKNGVFWVVTP